MNNAKKFVDECLSQNKEMTKTRLAYILGFDRMSLRNYEQGRMPEHIKVMFKVYNGLLEEKGWNNFLSYIMEEFHAPARI